MGMFLNQAELDGYVDEWCKKCANYSSNGAIADCPVLAAHKACQTEDVNRTPSVLAFFIKKKGGTNGRCTMFRSNAGEDIAVAEQEAPVEDDYIPTDEELERDTIPIKEPTGAGPSFESPAFDMGDGKIGYPPPKASEPDRIPPTAEPVKACPGAGCFTPSPDGSLCEVCEREAVGEPDDTPGPKPRTVGPLPSGDLNE